MVNGKKQETARNQRFPSSCRPTIMLKSVLSLLLCCFSGKGNAPNVNKWILCFWLTIAMRLENIGLISKFSVAVVVGGDFIIIAKHDSLTHLWSFCIIDFMISVSTSILLKGFFINEQREFSNFAHFIFRRGFNEEKSWSWQQRINMNSWATEICCFCFVRFYCLRSLASISGVS